MAPRTRPAVTATGRVLPSAHGPLRHLLLWFPREAAVRRGYRTVYAALLAELPPTTRLTILVHPGAAAVLDQLLGAAGRRAASTVLTSPADLRFTVWTRDPFVVVREGDATTFLTPSRFARQDDARAVEVTAAATGAAVVGTGVDFHGGDVLVDGSVVLIGRDCVGATLESTALTPGADGPSTPAEVVARFQQTVGAGRRVLHVGSDRALSEHRTRTLRVGGREVVEVLPGGAGRPHPQIHLDRFVTLAGAGASGRPRVVVGSPAAADRILGRAPVDAAFAAACDDVADQLEAAGYEVHRVPLPMTYGHGRREVDGTIRDVRLWYLATASNALVQHDPRAGDHVWLPTYGHGPWRELGITDEVTRRTWQELGFQVHQLPSFHTFAQRCGALRCITQELDRSPSA